MFVLTNFPFSGKMHCMIIFTEIIRKFLFNFILCVLHLMLLLLMLMHMLISEGTHAYKYIDHFAFVLVCLSFNIHSCHPQMNVFSVVVVVAIVAIFLADWHPVNDSRIKKITFSRNLFPKKEIYDFA